jgi:NAD(P)-dependent dehydrogenase (short-subunit alcohol dehydrogenase family)
MELTGRHVVVTGGAGGIGQALCRRFAEEGARAVVVADVTAERAQAVAADVDGLAIGFDAGTEAGVRALIDEATAANGPIDVFFSNAGVPGPMGGPDAPDDGWDECWRVNVMQHVWASRVLVPQMVQRGDGYLVNTASAAGLLTQVSAAPYSVTKAGAVSYAEWLAVIYGDAGIKVSCLCPQAVQTPMLDEAMQEPAGAAALRAGGILDPADVADVVVQAMREERFLILPHEEVAQHMALKAAQPDRWIGGMRKLVRRAKQEAAS